MTYTINQNVDVNAQVDIGDLNIHGHTISNSQNGTIVITTGSESHLDITYAVHISNLLLSGNDIGTKTGNLDLTFTPHGSGIVKSNAAFEVGNINLEDNTISSTNTNGNILLSPNGTGKIGVGTSSPDETLHIAGNVSIDAYAQGDGGGIFFRDGYNSGNDPYNLSITAKDWRGGTTTSDGFVISGFHGIGFQTNSNSYSSGNIRMFVSNNGIVGVGTISPTVGKIQVSGYVGGSVPRGYYTTHTSGTSIATQSTSGSGFAYSIYCSNAIGANGIGWTSDERIKTEISVVDDAWALQKVRDIECKEYHYKDPLMRKSQKTIGYIAQDVQQHLPQAVSVISEYIPDEMRPIENITWTPTENGFKVVIPNLTFSEEHTRDLLFYVSNNEDEEEQRIELTADEENAIIFEKQYTKVFLYGKKVNNFLQIAKDKIYSLHHSAIQEIDRRQTTDNERILELEGELSEAQETIATQAQDIATLQAQVAALMQHTGVTL